MFELNLFVIFSPSVMAVLRFYGNEVKGRGIQRAAKLYPQLSIATELCYNVELTGKCMSVSSEDANDVIPLTEKQMLKC